MEKVSDCCKAPVRIIDGIKCCSRCMDDCTPTDKPEPNAIDDNGNPIKLSFSGGADKPAQPIDLTGVFHLGLILGEYSRYLDNDDTLDQKTRAIRKRTVNELKRLFNMGG